MVESIEQGQVAILDAGSQYGKLIDRRVRELNAHSQILPISTTAKQLLDAGYKAIIISGGPANLSANTSPSCQMEVDSDSDKDHQQQANNNLQSPVNSAEQNNGGITINQTPSPGTVASSTSDLATNNSPMSYDPNILQCGLPVLGICYGFHLINREFHGTIQRKEFREDGQFTIKVDTTSPLFKLMNEEQQALLTHGDSVQDVAVDFKPIALSGPIIAAIANEQRKIYGVQFHPEVDLTTNGKQILKNFLYEIAQLPGDFTMKSREQECIDQIRATVGETDKVLVLLSGGVDSTVCAALFRRALKAEQVVAFHIDNGFMRKNESTAVEKSLNQLGLEVKGKCKLLLLQQSTLATIDILQIDTFCCQGAPFAVSKDSNITAIIRTNLSIIYQSD
jgi:GMP synthase-like glutamine amidotransferase